MKVLHVIPSLSPVRGGPSTVLPLVARALARQGVEVTVATTDDDGPTRHLTVPIGVPLERDGYTVRYFRRTTSFYTASWGLAQWVLREARAFDVIHTHALFTFSPIPVAVAGRLFGIPYVVRPLGTLNRWGLENRRPRLKKASLAVLERPILQGAAAVQFTSETEKDEAAFLRLKTRQVVIPLGVEPLDVRADAIVSFRARFPGLEGRRVVLYMSRFDPKKGLDLLLPAFARLRQTAPDVVLLLAGSGGGEFTQGLHTMVEHLGLEDSVVFPGFLQGEEKSAALGLSSAFVLPSYSENFGMAPVEAMSVGLPVVLSDTVGIAGDVTAAGAGVVVSPTVDAVADGIKQVLDDRQRAREMGLRGQELVQEKFTVDRTAARLIDLYVDIVTARKRGLS